MVRTIITNLQIDGADAHKVIRFQESHKLGVPPWVEVDFALADYQELDNIIGRAAVLSYGYEGEEPRLFAGVVESATLKGSGQMGMDGRLYRYVARVVPKMALLERSVDSRIFQEMDVKEIVTKVLENHNISGEAVEWKITGSYPKREYCVQYQESGLAFISRLLEEEGIWYVFEATDSGEDKVIFMDDSTVADPIPGDPELIVKPRASMGIDQDAIYYVADTRRVRSGKFVLRDYNFEKPQLDLTSTAEGKERTDLEVYDYPGIYLEPGEGKRLAQTRLEAEQSFASTLRVKAECMRFFAGKKITIFDSETLGGNVDGEWFITGLEHEYDGTRGDSGGSDSGFHLTATLLPGDAKFRPTRATPIPVILGPQTARVVAPAGSPVETIHTDKHGRVKVKFHWDRVGPNDDKASCWIRVQQLQTSGSMVIPRVEWEVIVEFFEGNPDRPYVTGRLYNGTYMPPYALPEGKTRTSFRTASTPGGGGMNEIRFEDKAGSEEIMIHAQYDMVLMTANNKKVNVGNNETSFVKNNSSLEVGANQTVKVTKGAKTEIGASQTVTVGGNRNVEVNAVTGITAKGNATISVGGNQFEMNGNPLEALLDIAAAKAVEFLTAKANQALDKIEGHVQNAVDQALGPVNNLASQANQIGQAMQAVANGDVSAMAGMAANASGIPGANQMVAAMGGGGQSQGGAPNPLADVAGALSQPQNMANSAIQQGSAAARGAAAAGIQRGVGAARNALGAALGLDSDGGGSESLANVSGPENNVEGVDQTDRAKGPGHSIAAIAGSHTEKIGSMKIRGTVLEIDTDVAANMTQTVGLAQAEIIIGERGENVTGNKDEKALGLVVLSKAGESETVGGSKTQMVGGLVYDKLKGTHSIEAGGPATFIGAFHKVEAKTKITFKCGGSSVVVDGSGFTVKSPIITILAAKIQLPKKVSEV
ncbi:MAG: type VI secretion system tip protein VgrG [Polyangiaceae bacterium]|nr:type VI secretion system tip protein VgrG [Polyangiaceae bacterium]